MMIGTLKLLAVGGYGSVTVCAPIGSFCGGSGLIRLDMRFFGWDATERFVPVFTGVLESHVQISPDAFNQSLAVGTIV